MSKRHSQTTGVVRNGSAGYDLNNRSLIAMQDSISCMAAVFALFLPTPGHARDEYLKSVGFTFNQFFSASVESAAKHLSQDIKRKRLSVIQYATQQLRELLGHEATLKVLLNLERVLRAQDLYDLMNCAAVQCIRNELDANFPVLTKTVGKNTPDAAQRSLKPAEQMGEEFALLLSLMLEASNIDGHRINSEYWRLLNCYTNVNIPCRTGRESGVTSSMETAFQLLLMQPIGTREAFVQHCLEIAQLNQRFCEEHSGKLRVFSEALGCGAYVARMQCVSTTSVSRAVCAT